MTWQLHLGDCLEVMRGMEANTIDSVITDPPYGLSFMGKDWDHGVPGVAYWAEALRVAKPGAMLLAFGGPRTFHRLTCAIEDAGWEVRDVVTWLYGSGFPKSHDISKAIDKAAGEVREVVGRYQPPNGTEWNLSNDQTRSTIGAVGHSSRADSLNITAPATPDAATWAGWGTSLKPAWEPVILAMKPLDGTFADNALTWGVAGLNVDGARIAHNEECKLLKAQTDDAVMTGNGKYGQAGRRADVLELKPSGRWPANLLLDEDAAAALDEASGVSKSPPIGSTCYGAGNTDKYGWAKTDISTRPRMENGYGDTGGASRFFYVAKASRAERNAGLEGMEAREKKTLGDYVHPSEGRTAPKNGSPMENFHPTVKPLALMRYLCRLTATPTGGVVLDPFMGSGTTGVACVMEGRDFIGIDKEAEYVEIARRRIAAAELPLLAQAAD